MSAEILQHTPASRFPDSPLSQMFAPGQSTKALFWKTKRLPSPPSASAQPLSFFFSSTVFLSSRLPFHSCFSSTCSCQISLSCHLSVVNRQLRRLGPGLQVVAVVVEELTEYKERIQVSVTLSLSPVSVSSLLSLSLSLQGHGWALPSGDVGPWRSQGAYADGRR